MGSLGQVKLFFNKSDDGRTWTPISSKASPFSLGGISEVGWAVDDESGVLYGVGRNEDGDDSGWGSRVLKFDPETMEAPQWIGNQSNPNIYESPRMFTHEDSMFLVARTDPNGPFMSENLNLLPATAHHLYDLIAYSLRPHGTALWKLNRDTAQLEWLMDLPGCGDTAFPSIVKISPHTYLILNYSSPLEEDCTNWPWIEGQVHPKGTWIYSVTIEFIMQ